MKQIFLSAILTSLLFLSPVSGEEVSRRVNFETFDLDIGETVRTRTGQTLTLLSVDEPKGKVWG